MRRRALPAGAVVLAALAALLATASPAHAHAVLQGTTPPDGARLDAAPDEVVLQFSEPVSAPGGALQVVDGDGSPVVDGEVATAGSSVTIRLADDLGAGAYIASYRVVSADAHPIQGAFSFTVGDAAPAGDAAVASVVDDGGDRPAEVAAGVARWSAYLGALLAAGGAVHLVVVERGTGGRWPHRRLLRAAAGVGAAGVVLGLPIQAHLATGLGAGSLWRPGVASVVLGDGVAWAAAVTLAGLVLVAVALGRRRAGAAGPPLLLLGAALAVAGFPLTGHTTTSDPRWLATSADVVHLAAAAVWFGGLVLLARSLAARRHLDDAAPAGRLVARFSAVATVAVLAVGAAGVVLGWREVRTVDGLTGTGYGQLLLVKTAIVAAIALVGAYNRFRLVPALVVATRDRPERGGWRLLRRTVSLEAGAMVVALAVTAVLVNVTPARAEQRGPASTTVPLGDGDVNIVVDPASVGPTQLHVYLLDDTGRPADGTLEGLVVELALPASGIGPLSREPVAIAPDHYVLESTDLSVPGRWQVTVLARVSTFELERATAEVTIGA